MFAYLCRAQVFSLVAFERFPRRAEEVLQRAAPGDEISESVRTQVRGKAICRFFASDPTGRNLETACMLNVPLQSFLNRAFAAEAATTKATECICETPLVGSAPGEESAQLQESAMRRNWAIISGDQGRDVVDQMADLVRDYRTGAWTDLTLDSEARYSASLTLLRGMTDAWRRLVFNFTQPKFELFRVCLDDRLSQPLLDTVVRPLLLRHTACAGCVDTAFCLQWVRRLLDPRPAVAKRAHRCLRDILSCLPVSSAKCERKHLLGAETRCAKRRGRALKPKALGKVTYAKSVSCAAQRMRRKVLDSVCGTNSKVRRRFAQGVASFRVRRWRKRSAEGQVEGTALRRKRTLASVRAYDVFVSEKFSNTPVDLPFAKRRRAVDEAWRKVPKDRLPYYQGRAQAENASSSGLQRLGFAEFVEDDRAKGLRRHKRLTAKRVAIGQSARALQDHPVWTAGSQVGSFESGLAADKVLTHETDTAMKAEANRIFAFVPKALASSRVPMKPFTPCCLRFGGLCQHDPLRAACEVGTKNLYSLLAHQKAQKDLPLAFRLNIDVHGHSSGHLPNEYYFLASTVGKGDLITFVRAQIAGEEEGRESMELCVPDGAGRNLVSTSHMVIRALLMRTAGQLGIEAVTLDRLTAVCLATRRGNEASGLRARVTGERFSEVLSLRAVRRQARAKTGPVKLPFGLSFNPADIPEDIAKGTGVEGASGSGTSEDEEEELRLRAEEELSSESAAESSEGDEGEIEPPVAALQGQAWSFGVGLAAAAFR